jgi:hypothetical protein
MILVSHYTDTHIYVFSLPHVRRNTDNYDLGEISGPKNLTWISHQHWWWVSMWADDRVSQVCWMCLRSCSGRSFSVVNHPSDNQRSLHRSHLLNSFPFVMLWIHALDGKLCDVVCSILSPVGLPRMEIHVYFSVWLLWQGCRLIFLIGN